MKNNITIKRAIAYAWDRMPKEFQSKMLINEVRYILGTEKYDGSIFSELRKLRGKYPKIYGYVCTDGVKSIYRKVEI